MPVRFFTVEEANALVPRLNKMIGDILAARQRILEIQPETRPVLEKAGHNGGNPAAASVVQEFEKVQRNVQGVTDLGVVLKDLNTGLVDFPTEREGRQVYLCWRYGEDRVAYWHELDTGFAGRRPL